MSAAAPRLPQETLAFREELDVLKFLCKDLWVAVFHKQMDSLRTNHQVCSWARGPASWLRAEAETKRRLERAPPHPRGPASPLWASAQSSEGSQEATMGRPGYRQSFHRPPKMGPRSGQQALVVGSTSPWRVAACLELARPPIRRPRCAGPWPPLRGPGPQHLTTALGGRTTPEVLQLEGQDPHAPWADTWPRLGSSRALLHSSKGWTPKTGVLREGSLQTSAQRSRGRRVLAYPSPLQRHRCLPSPHWAPLCPQGTYVLQDNSFPLLIRMASGPQYLEEAPKVGRVPGLHNPPLTHACPKAGLSSSRATVPWPGTQGRR